MDDILMNLNEKQREAVLETEGYVRVIAGAGSGKTKLLVSRYAYLVQDYGIDSANILCVTFTNKAASEMKKRIRTLIGDGYDTNLVCTYHGFCNRLLRENPEKLFLNKQFQIMDSSQQKAILGEIYQKYELKLDYASFEAILHKIGQAKKDMSYVAKLCNPKPCQVLPEIKTKDDRIIEEFLQKQKATYSLDFQDLIFFAIHLLETDEAIRNKWQDKLNYIMVDEFQDSSAVEMRLLELLSGKYQNLMIVGDPDQNIYEWRGALARILVDFDKTHVPTKTIILNQNYRSTPQILQCANTLIEKNKLRLKKDLYTENAEGAPVCHYHSKNDFEEMDQVITNIKRLHEKERFSYSDFAIIYRSGFLSRIAEKKLLEKNIPYEIFGGIQFFQRMEILDILAYLKLIAYDEDASFQRIANTPRRRFGRAKMNALETLKEPEDSLFTTLSRHLDERELANSDIAPFVHFIEEVRKDYHQKRISDLVNMVTEKSGYEAYIRELGDEERLNNLAEFKRIANEFEREFGENLTLEEFLIQIALQSGEDRQESRDTVKLMTIHSSKGLEFPAVFILGFTEGVFPSSKTIEDRKEAGLEEERRLCYVAMTRAEKYLFLMESEGTSQNGMKKLVSRFLDEIGPQNYVRIGQISESLKRESREYAAKLNFEISTPINEQNRKIGDVVEHHIFGKGVIESIDEKRGSYSVKFENMPQPRNISIRYFATEHKDARQQIGTEQERMPDTAEQAAEVKEMDLPGFSNSKNTVTDAAARIAKTTEAIKETIAKFKKVSKPKETFDSKEAYEPRENSESKDAYDPREAPEPMEVPITTAEKTPLNTKQKKVIEKTSNLWKNDQVPHSGWNCTDIEDLGSPSGICEMCGYQIIRYVHHMEHPKYRSLSVGCICAGKMEGDIERAKRREADFKNQQSRHTNFLKKEWKRSQKGNEYLKIDNHVIVLFHVTKPNQGWKYSIDNEFCNVVYPTREKAVAGAFDALEKRRK